MTTSGLQTLAIAKGATRMTALPTHTIARVYPGQMLALYDASGQLVEDDFPSWHDAELAAVHLDAIADTPSDPPGPDDPTPTNVGDDPPPWGYSACPDCHTAHHIQKCPILLAALLA